MCYHEHRRSEPTRPGDEAIDIRHPINIGHLEFTQNKERYYTWLREEAPVYKGKVSIMSVYLLSRYDDCVLLLTDPRFVRNRTTATGGGRMPFSWLMPRSVKMLMKSMIQEDDPEHRRLRSLVQQAFTTRAIEKLGERIERLTHELLDQAEPQGTVDLLEAYALPIPVTVIREMVGVSEDDMPRFRNSFTALTQGMSGWRMLRTLFWDLPRSVKFVRGLIDRKRSDPKDDILTGLIQAEEAGKKLSEDELVSLVLLLIVAGYETTVHLIGNSILTLLQHPQTLARVRAEPALVAPAIEEVLRFRGPVQGTKPMYATEDVTLHGVTIPKGAMVMPMLGAANRDPSVFDDPDTFDIDRSPNKHLGFGHGIHFCLGASLARMETRIALTNLLARNPNLRLTIPESQLELINLPLWHRYARLPVALG